MIFSSGMPSCGMANWRVYMRRNLTAIAARYGGFKTMPTDDMNDMIERVNSYENKSHRLAEVLCDGDPRGFAFLSDLAYNINPSIASFYRNQNVERAEAELESSEERIKNELAAWFVDEDKFKREFFINRDPRGYALKLDFGDERVEGVFRDWGNYGIIAPEDF